MISVCYFMSNEENDRSGFVSVLSGHSDGLEWILFGSLVSVFSTAIVL